MEIDVSNITKETVIIYIVNCKLLNYLLKLDRDNFLEYIA